MSFNFVICPLTPHQRYSWAFDHLLDIDLSTALIILGTIGCDYFCTQTISNINYALKTLLTCKPLIGIDITSGGVLCEEPSRAVRKLESNIRLQSNRIKEFIEGLERYLNSSILQVKFVQACFFFMKQNNVIILSYCDTTVTIFN